MLDPVVESVNFTRLHKNITMNNEKEIMEMNHKE